MTPDLHALHVAAGLRAGRDRTCGKKVAYGSEESAAKAALAMSRKPTTRSTLEAYPCAFCEKWHVGRKMSEDELAGRYERAAVVEYLRGVDLHDVAATIEKGAHVPIVTASLAGGTAP